MNYFINKHKQNFDLLYQVELWKKYINFEKSNPLRSEDTVVITKRGKQLFSSTLADICQKEQCELSLSGQLCMYCSVTVKPLGPVHTRG